MLKKLLFISILLVSRLSIAQGSHNVKLLDNWQDLNLLSNSSLVRYNDVWGYEKNGQEYAFIGTTEGINAFNIDVNGKLLFIDSIQGRYVNSGVIHRDLKIYDHYLYTVCDEGISSLQIIDLNFLPDSLHKVADIGGAFGRVHNLFIDDANKLLYACSVTPEIGGALQSLIPMQVYSIMDPINPVLVYEGPGDIPEVHDAFVINNIAYLNCGFDGLRVYDFTNALSPSFLQNMSFYQDQGYNHQGWMTPNGNYYIFGDETNEKKLKKCLVGSDHTLTIDKTFGTNWEDGSVAHNIMLDNNFAFVAYYNEGLRIYDLRYRIPKEIGHYDTYPDDSPFKMFGAWGVYSALPSGRILVSDRIYGLFVLDFDRGIFQVTSDHFEIYPNPVNNSNQLKIRLDDYVTSFEVQIADMKGELLLEQSFLNQNYGIVDVSLFAKGVYQLSVEFTNYLGELELRKAKLIVQ